VLYYEFLHPLAFIFLPLLICIYKCPKSIKEKVFPHTHLFKKRYSLINIEKIIYSAILTFLILALASPISYTQKSSNIRKGRDLVFVLDTSGSMAESGFNKENKSEKKIDTLKNIIKDFINKRLDDNIGVSIFGTYAFGAVPLTYDMKSIDFLLDFFDVGIAGENTAIGDGLDKGIKLLDKGSAKNKVIILITDGEQNSGSVSIKDATQNAKDKKIKIYTIGITQEFDKKLLELISKQTDAKMFSAKDAKTLKSIYNELDKLEPSNIKSKHYLNMKTLYIYPLSFAMFLMLYLIIHSRESKI
jgi:Ca-activated chloride channel family protein